MPAFSPEAVFEEGQYLTVTVAPRKWHDLDRFLHDDPELQFDYLASLIGVRLG